MKFRILKVDPDVLAPFGEEDEREDLFLVAERLLHWGGRLHGRPSWVYVLRVCGPWGRVWLSDPFRSLRAAWIALHLESCRLSGRELEGVTR